MKRLYKAPAWLSGLAQRYLLRDQFVTPDGQPLTQRFSDLLLLGSTTVIPSWSLDASMQYSPDIRRPVRSITSARYSPGPFRTFNATYRLARGLTEQLESRLAGGRGDPLAAARELADAVLPDTVT